VKYEEKGEKIKKFSTGLAFGSLGTMIAARGCSLPGGGGAEGGRGRGKESRGTSQER